MTGAKLQLVIPAQYEPTGLVLPEGMEYEQWESIGHALKKINNAALWWLGDWWAYGDHHYGERAAQALDPDSYAFQTLMNAGWVCRQIETSRRREVLSFSHHAEVAALDPSEADALLDKAEAEGWNRQELRRQAKRVKIGNAGAPALPSSKYRIIYADPPWSYGDKLIEGYGSAEHHYPSMSIEALCAMPVEEMVEDNAVLFLWVTSPLLEECFPVIKAWGFKYKTSMIWNKDAHNFGHYVSVRHELLLICTKGSCTPDAKTLPPSVVTEKREEHSVKPETFRTIIDSMYTRGKKLELFRRGGNPEGWTAWGNESHAN